MQIVQHHGVQVILYFPMPDSGSCHACKMKYGVTLISTFNMDNIRLNASFRNDESLQNILDAICGIYQLQYKSWGNKLFSLIKQKLMNLKIKINLLSKMKKNYQSIVNLKSILLLAGISLVGILPAQSISFASENLTTRLQKLACKQAATSHSIIRCCKIPMPRLWKGFKIC